MLGPMRSEILCMFKHVIVFLLNTHLCFSGIKKPGSVQQSDLKPSENQLVISQEQNELINEENKNAK